jgi:replicative DNA helicase
MTSQVMQLLSKIAHRSIARRPAGGFQTLQQIRESSIGNVENLMNRDVKITGLATGFVGLDKMTKGLQKGELTIIAAPLGMGSTAFAMNIALNAAIHQNAIVGIFSLEMNKLTLLQRMLGSQTGLHIQRIVHGFLTQEDMGKVESAMEKLDAARVSIDDTTGVSLAGLRSRARQLRKDQNGLDLIVVDALQLMSANTLSKGRSAYENSIQDLSAISRGLRALAKELNVPVIATLQLPEIIRNCGGDRRPTLNDLRVHGSIEQDADLVIFIHREAYYCVDEEIAEADARTAEIIVAKHYNGPTRTFYLNFIAACTLFGDL